MDLTHLPIVAGGLALYRDRADPRREIALVLLGYLLILIGLEAAGKPLGQAGQMALNTFAALIGYYVGKKEPNGR